VSGGSVLVAAQGGDEQAFVELTSPHRAALHAHCYRLLGSLHDADDALQESLLRAWRGISSFQPHAPLAAWLYRVSTNVCLRMLEQRARRPDVPGAHLEPYPDDAALRPDALAERREEIGLAFVAAMQLLPPRQRVVLVLSDALDWPAREVAELLEVSVASVNSLLQRARARVARERSEPVLARVHTPADPAVEAAVMRRFQEAWEDVDVEAIVALLETDALLTMPPEGARIEGAEAVGRFFATVPLDGRLDDILLRPARANGQPALAAYALREDRLGHDAYGVMVFALAGDRIAGITGFADRPDLFLRLGLPVSLG
jgi:RNA polymerase sigma-70 factor, ECF subfamily